MAESNLDGLLPQVDNDKKTEVERIVDSDRVAFEDWYKDPQHAQSFADAPHAAMRYILVPKVFLELSNDPEAVNAVIIDQTAKRLNGIVVEHKLQPVSNSESYEQYNMLLEQKRKNTPNDEIFIPPDGPDDIDPEHLLYNSFVEQGLIDFNDYVANVITLDVNENGCLYVGTYHDREELRGKGVAKSFYKRLQDVARKMGFRYITGNNDTRNLSFFTGTLGRSLIKDIKPEYWHLFMSTQQRAPSDTDTIDFLYPEDKLQFLSSK